MKEGNVISEDFLLGNERSKILYHEYARHLPIIDYHNHLPPQEIAENKKFSNLTEIWLKGDHYKWRGMRALGVKEALITGNTSDREKFMAWAAIVPATVRNPLFHWTHMELKDPFGINSYLNKNSADAIYEHCNVLLQQDKFSAQGLLKHYQVEMVGTTDDPCDNLMYHKQLAESDFSVQVKPSFRPDKVLLINKPIQFKQYLDGLSDVSGIPVNDLGSLVFALRNRVDFFHTNLCSISDHGLSALPLTYELTDAERSEFEQFLKTDGAEFSNPDAFAGYILTELCKMYHERGWVQQFHLGAIRNNNLGMFNQLGADSGYDSIGDFKHAERLSAFFGNLSLTDQLTKTIIYNLNPADNEVFAAMTGNFADGNLKGKMQFGSGWWFLDQKDGIEKQLNTLSNLGMISTFVGMLTDSRSFLSYSRHDYFRRILCNLFGSEMESGLLPDDEKWIGEIIGNICYYNARNYFDLKIKI
ncbi:glucuronate isomerase [Pedobacter metabolipauper]|uniref:Uronate isomerase n=1 Tax=Pedobacter metabolipauper TaxID=425513 RepID=A0A4V3D1E6_9SPHI|nr:glucuronate isomerase [Pedobacter metabolipauper]TDQ10943.1 glucuronate isomerase [Pedobacter metabolipauper]